MRRLPPVEGRAHLEVALPARLRIQAQVGRRHAAQRRDQRLHVPLHHGVGQHQLLVRVQQVGGAQGKPLHDVEEHGRAPEEGLGVGMHRPVRQRLGEAGRQGLQQLALSARPFEEGPRRRLAGLGRPAPRPCRHGHGLRPACPESRVRPGSASGFRRSHRPCRPCRSRRPFRARSPAVRAAPPERSSRLAANIPVNTAAGSPSGAEASRTSQRRAMRALPLRSRACRKAAAAASGGRGQRARNSPVTGFR